MRTAPNTVLHFIQLFIFLFGGCARTSADVRTAADIFHLSSAHTSRAVAHIPSVFRTYLVCSHREYERIYNVFHFWRVIYHTADLTRSYLIGFWIMYNVIIERIAEYKSSTSVKRFTGSYQWKIYAPRIGTTANSLSNFCHFSVTSIVRRYGALVNTVSNPNLFIHTTVIYRKTDSNRPRNGFAQTNFDKINFAEWIINGQREKRKKNKNKYVVSAIHPNL